MQAKEEARVTPSEPIATTEDDKTTEETLTPSENLIPMTLSEEENAASKSQDIDVENIAVKPHEEEVLESNQVTIFTEVIPEPKEATMDKKRPLEEDEDDEIENNRDAKQPRFFSPDKVILFIIYIYHWID